MEAFLGLGALSMLLAGIVLIVLGGERSQHAAHASYRPGSGEIAVGIVLTVLGPIVALYALASWIGPLWGP